MTVDYHNFCDINTPPSKRQLLNIGDIYSNGLECKLCGWYIRSRNAHDMVSCNCKACSIDGGSWYVKINALNFNDVIVRTIMFNEEKDNETNS